MKRYKLYVLTLLMALPLSLAAQTRTVKGQVLDAATGKPVSGALVKVLGQKASALTEDDGFYTLKLSDNASAIQITSPDHNLVMMGLQEGEMQRTALLYSTEFRQDYSRTIDVRDDKQATKDVHSSAINIKQDLQDQLGAFAYSINRNGTAGVGTVMFVQGLNSLNANAQPLVVVDGVILDQQFGNSMLHQGYFNDVLSNINPSDIEHVSVMRNGTALYGARGANGVIVIETKRSHSMTTKITATASAGVSLEPKFYDMMDAEQYRGYASELLKYTDTKIINFKFLNPDPDYYYYKQYHNNTDWKEGIYRTAINQNYGIDVEGGDDIAMYNLSVGFTSNQGNMECNEMNRLNVRFNSDIFMTDKLKVSFDASFSNLTRNIRNDGAPLSYDEGTPNSPSFLAYVKSPFLNPYSYGNGDFSKSYLDVNDETYLDEALSSYSGYNYKLGNPWAFNQYGDAENKNHLENSLLNISVIPSYSFNKHLNLREHFSYTLVNTNNKYYIPINGVPDYYVSSVSAYRQNEVRSLASKQNSLQSDTRLDWQNRFGSHSVSAFGGVRINWETYNRNAQIGYNTGSDKTPFMSGALLNAKSEGSNDLWRNMDVYAQADYSYLDRYYAQANLTVSGSSRFGVDAKGMKLGGVVWGVFPGLQASWLVTNEAWCAKQDWLDYLKVNAGYEMVGNDDIYNYAARSFFGTQMYLNAVSGLSFNRIGNTEIKWETTNRFHAGFESNMIQNRLHAAVNLFYSKTKDLLSLQTLGFLSGLESNWTNAGELSNRGFDITLSGKVIATKNATWEVGVSVGHYKNKIEKLSDGKNAYNTDVMGATIRTEVGQPANLFYGYKTKGVFATTDEAMEAGLYILNKNGVNHDAFGAGDMIFVDNDGNKRIDENDRVIIGNPNPDIYGNIFSSATYKRFRLDLNFNYSLGNDAFNYMRSQLEGGSRFMNQTTALTNRWQIEGQKTDIPQITFQDPMGNSRFSDRWIEDASYLRLKAVTLSYKLPINNAFIQGLEFWVQGNNLFTLTKYLGSDPEFSATSSVIGQGIDLGCIGLSRSFVAGIKINL